MKGLQPSLSEKLKAKVTQHRKDFIEIFKNRYLEMLPNLIVYNIQDEKNKNVAIDFTKLEYMLRNNNYNVVVGIANDNIVKIFGYVNNYNSIENSSNLYNTGETNPNDINFIVPRETIPTVLKEISYSDNCKTGNFIVIKNKAISRTSDIAIISHYLDRLSEIVVSRYSLAMQSRMNTIFKGDPDSELANQIIGEVYSGSPFIKLSDYFDPDEDIIRVDNTNLSVLFDTLKKEYQNNLGEMNNMLGLSSLSVEKESGVSNTEARGNESFTIANGNINLTPRQYSFDKLNKRIGTNIKCMYNDKLESELNKLHENDNNYQ